MSAVTETDVVIIGAGPVGLFAVFQLGMLGIATDVVDILDRPGGQCAELYPEKPIYDIPGLPVVTGQGLVDNLMKQIAPFTPRFHLGRMITTIDRQEDGRFRLISDTDDVLVAKAVIVAGGGGSFQPKRPPVPGIDAYEGISVFYAVRDMERFRNRRVLIVGGGDSALDWTLALAPLASRVTLMHRRDVFRAAPESLRKMRVLVESRAIDLEIGQIAQVEGNDGYLERVIARREDGSTVGIDADILLPFFGLIVKFGPVATWGLDLHGSAIRVDTEKFQTSRPGIFAIGDINWYPGKQKLILSGFHEASLAAHGVARHLDPEREVMFQHSTSSTLLQGKLGVAV